jgi:hypothetical protein
MNFQDFFIKWKNKQCDTGSFPGQCVNIVKEYFIFLGLQPLQGDAIDYWTRPPQGFQKISKTWYNQPLPGDLTIFNYKPVGHIAICNWSRLFDFGAFEQNFPVGSPCHFQDHPNYKNVLGWLRPSPSRFTMQYTCFNADPVLMEQARKLLLKYSDGKLDASFTYFTIPPISVPSLWTTEAQIIFLNQHPVSTPFAFLNYQGYDPGHSNLVTRETPGSKTILTASMRNQTPFYICYEFLHGIQFYLMDKGLPVGMPDDVFTPDEAFLKMKIEKILPFVGG